MLVNPIFAQSGMITNITEDVETDFGTYHPYETIFTANVPLFNIESDFSNVTNFSWLSHNFNTTDSSLLLLAGDGNGPESQPASPLPQQCYQSPH